MKVLAYAVTGEKKQKGGVSQTGKWRFKTIRAKLAGDIYDEIAKKLDSYQPFVLRGLFIPNSVFVKFYRERIYVVNGITKICKSFDGKVGRIRSKGISETQDCDACLYKDSCSEKMYLRFLMNTNLLNIENTDDYPTYLTIGYKTSSKRLIEVFKNLLYQHPNKEIYFEALLTKEPRTVDGKTYFTYVPDFLFVEKETGNLILPSSMDVEEDSEDVEVEDSEI